MSYNPMMGSLITHKDEEVGNYIPLWTGISGVDQASRGLNPVLGEILGIQSLEKNRKTSTALNITYNIAMQLRAREVFAAYDTSESGMTPYSVRDQLIAITAILKMIADELGPKRDRWGRVSQIQTMFGEDLELSKEIVFEGKDSMSERQFHYVQESKKALMGFPLAVFGGSREQGLTRSLEYSLERWGLLYDGKFPGLEEKLFRVFVCDNIQLYHGFSSDKFNQLESVVAAHANFCVTHPGSIIIDISQISQTSAINAKIHQVSMYAKGGGALAAEATILLQPEYEQDDNRIIIKCAATRKKPFPDMIQEIAPASGAFLRPAYPSNIKQESLM